MISSVALKNISLPEIKNTALICLILAVLHIMFFMS